MGEDSKPGIDYKPEELHSRLEEQIGDMIWYMESYSQNDAGSLPKPEELSYYIRILPPEMGEEVFLLFLENGSKSMGWGYELSDRKRIEDYLKEKGMRAK